MKTFEVFEHTADIGLRAWGKDLKHLFVNAAEGMFCLITGGKTANKAGMGFLVYKKIKAQYYKEQIVCDAPDIEALLVFWLSDLLYAYSTKEILFQDFDIQAISQHHIRASCYGPHADEVGEPKTEIKAVTFHQVKVEHKKDTWEAKIIFDI